MIRMQFLRYVKAPLLLLICLSLVLFLGEIGVIPEFHYLIDMLKDIFFKYGLVVVFLASVLENTIIINFAFPGAIVILSAMAISSGNIPLAVATFLCIWLGSIFGLCLSYLIGYKASGVMKTNEEFRSHSRIFVSTFWHPQLASMSVYNFGINRAMPRRFLTSALAINLMWNLFWAILVYKIGNIFDSSESIKYLLFLVLVCWLLLLCYRFQQKLD